MVTGIIRRRRYWFDTAGSVWQPWVHRRTGSKKHRKNEAGCVLRVRTCEYASVLEHVYVDVYAAGEKVGCWG